MDVRYSGWVCSLHATKLTTTNRPQGTSYEKNMNK